MSKYEVTFDVVEVPDDLADDLLDRFDCLIGTHHGGQDYVTITATGGDCVAAAKAMTTQLQLLGLVVLRMREDLGSRNDIAERLGVTRQAVGNWVRGDRGSGFPPPYNDVCGGIWLWGDIVRWAEAHGAYDAMGVGFPERQDHDRVNGWLSDGCAVPPLHREGWLSATPARTSVSWTAFEDARVIPCDRFLTKTKLTASTSI